MKHVLCAGNAVKEVMSATNSLAALEAGARASNKPLSNGFLISDGGDGFLEACGQGHNYVINEAACTGPLGDAISAPYLIDSENETAYIEIALCSGLKLVEKSRRNVMISGTAGVADLVYATRMAGVKKLYIGLGGSATCDGGAGFLWRLAELSGQCRRGYPEPRIAMDLPELPSPDIQALCGWLAPMEIIGCVDVDNPLRGPNGAAKVFAPQKGADPDQAELLEGWMGDWCIRIERSAGMKLCAMPGAGAAGGLGFAVAAVGATLVCGARMVFDLTNLSDAISDGTTLLTVEGRFDATSMGGKATWEAALLARERGGHAAIFCGVADRNALAEAVDRQIAVVEFGRDITENQRVTHMPAMLTAAVTEYLTPSISRVS